MMQSQFIEKKTQDERVLYILEQAKGQYVDGMTFLNIHPPITQFHARIWSLQKKGHNIQGRVKEGTNWKEYKLIPAGALL